MRPHPIARPALAAVLSASALLLAACGSGDETSGTLTPSETLEVTPTTENLPFEAQEVDTIEVDDSDFRDPALDEGLNVEYHFQGTQAGDYGGTLVSVAVTNLNDVPLPAAELGTDRVSLRYNSGGGEMTQAELLQTEVPETAPPLQVPLDLPLGAGATTNLHFTFDVSRGNLWDAEFKVGNVMFTGDLVI